MSELPSEASASLTIIHPIHEHVALHMPFIHALSLAYTSRGELEIVDVRKEKTRHDEQANIREVLEKWGVLPSGSKREDVGKLGMRVKKIIKDGGSNKEIAKRLKRREHDICVIGTAEMKGLGKLFGQELSEYLVQYFRQTTLYIPSGARPFINDQNGKACLRKIIIPVAKEPFAEPAFTMLHKLLDIYPDQEPRVIGLHCGDFFPFVSATLLEGIDWEEKLLQENVVPSILTLASKEQADLIIMTTNGRDTFSQKIIGSITEQVLHHVSCPVLAVAV